jgi:hypothetical protein
MTPTVVITYPLSQIRLNEVMPVTGAVYLDEWVELRNTDVVTANLAGWSLDDGPAGSPPYVLPLGTELGPGAFLLLYGQITGLILNDAGGQLQLLDPLNTVMDEVIFSPLLPDASYSRDEAGLWHADWPPSPGGPNVLPSPTPTP